MNQNKSIEKYLEEGTFHLERSHYDKSLEIFQEADSLFPNNPEIKNYLGLTYFRKEQYSKSIEYLNFALELKPDYLSALVRRGLAYKYSEQTELANQDYEAVLQVEPKTYEDWRSRGLAYDELKQKESALKCYDKALEINPNDYLSLVNKGISLQNSKQYELALQAYDLSLSIFPERFFTHSNRAYILFYLGLYEEALNGYSQALRLKPDDCNCHTQKGTILIKLKKYSVALTSLNQALEINPKWLAAKIKKFYLLEYLNNDAQQEQNLNVFLVEILLTINSGCEQEHIHNILGNNLSLLELLSAEFIQKWADNNLQQLATELNEEFAQDLLIFGIYIGKFSQGNKAKHIEIGIKCCNSALKVFSEKDHPSEWAMTVRCIGLAYLNRIEGDRKDNIETAINSFNVAFSVFTEKEYPFHWALTFLNLGLAYLYRVEGDRKENLEFVISTCCEASFSVFTEEEYPFEWASALINGSNAFLFRIEGDRKENLEFAIKCCNAAFSVFTEEEYPFEWASALINLGGVYLHRIEGDRKENLENSIICCETACKVFTEKEYPFEWAIAQMNLSHAFFSRVAGNRQKNLKSSINHCNESLKVFTQATYSKEWALINLNLGTAFCFLSEDNPGDNLSNAIYFLNKALEVLTKDDFPEEWAMIHLNFGLVFCYETTNKEQSIEEAITKLKKALEVFSKDHLPYCWSMIQQNLGVAYEGRIVGDRQYNLQKAINYYRSALTIETPQTNPFRCLEVSRNLGSLAFTQGNWELAIEAFSIAIQAIESSRLISIDDERRQEIMSTSIDVYMEMVQVLINSGQTLRAIEIAERSRSKRLVDLMASNDLYSDGNIDPDVVKYLKEIDDLQRKIDFKRNNLSDNTGDDSGKKSVISLGINSGHTRALHDYKDLSDEIKKLIFEQQYIWLKIRSLDPVISKQIQVDPISFSDICQLIPDDQTAIIYFYMTRDRLQVFVVHKDKSVQLHTTNIDFNELIKFSFDSWKNPYNDSFELWQKQIPQNLEKLSSKLNLSQLIIDHLINIKELIIIPHLYLHIIPFAALPILPTEDFELTNEDQELLIDRFKLRILPSAQILEFCHQRDFQKEVSNIEYGIVEDADNSLPFAQFEGEQIAKIFEISNENRLKGIEQATVKNYRELVSRVQVLHSSHHAVSCLYDSLQSRLNLADGDITLLSIMSPSWRFPNLQDVFLSCCETNFGRTEKSDDPLTLATGFLCAGARSVVSTLWAVDDLATAIFSITYYQLRKEGLDRPTALQQAQHRLRTMSGKDLKDKYNLTLGKFLRTQHNSIVQRRKDIKSRRSELSKTSEVQAGNEDLIKEFKQLQNKGRLLHKQIQRFRALTRTSLPFAHPYYWAGFISQGLR